jgi:hypothetical protein
MLLDEVRGWTGAAAARRDKELARIVAHLKRQAAAGGLSELSANELLSAGARRRLDELSNAGVATVDRTAGCASACPQRPATRRQK